jgi:hypothetical protein
MLKLEGVSFRQGGSMTRRKFIILLGGTVVAWPLAARAQQNGRTVRIGVFAGATIPVMAQAYRAFVDELRRLGFSEGQNLIIELRAPDRTLSTYQRSGNPLCGALGPLFSILGFLPGTLDRPLRDSATAGSTPEIIRRPKWNLIRRRDFAAHQIEWRAGTAP